jgi:hypothetical protein
MIRARVSSGFDLTTGFMAYDSNPILTTDDFDKSSVVTRQAPQRETRQLYRDGLVVAGLDPATPLMEAWPCHTNGIAGSHARR